MVAIDSAGGDLLLVTHIGSYMVLWVTTRLFPSPLGTAIKGKHRSHIAALAVSRFRRKKQGANPCSVLTLDDPDLTQSGSVIDEESLAAFRRQQGFARYSY